jgi:ubiquinone/menaquinone biosynthesis C-methylase UbiE
MSFKQKLSKQFGKPAGKTGNLIGMAMAVKNKERNMWGIEKMRIQPDDRILEIGYGPGTSVKIISQMLSGGTISGIDHSDVMCRQAIKRNAEGIKDNKVELMCGSARDLTYPENTFDKIFASNVHFFWDEPEEEFRRLGTMLKAGGKFCLIFQPRWAKTEQEVKQIAEDTKSQFKKTGFRVDELAFKKMKPVTCVYLCGIKT